VEASPEDPEHRPQGVEDHPDELGQLGHALHIQLFHKVLSVRMDGFCADRQAFADLFDTSSLGQHAKDFPFSLGELVQRFVPLFRRLT